MRLMRGMCLYKSLLSCYSTAEFRNAFLKTIRQIIRESVRNMSIPSLKSMGGSTNSMTGVGNSSSGNSQTLERPKQQVSVFVTFFLFLGCKNQQNQYGAKF